MQPVRRPSSNAPRHRRDGISTLEFILVMPVFIIALMAIVEFGLLLSNQQYVEMASRTGAQTASRENIFSETNGAPVPANVLTVVAEELAKVGITNYTVLMEHNIDFVGPVATLSGTTTTLKSVVGTGPVTVPTPPAVTLTPNRKYVRVTVCVMTTELAPNLLSLYGFNISTRVSSDTTLRRYSL